MSVTVFLADGFEEIEALSPVDILRRGGCDVKTAGVGGLEITGAHGIRVHADLRDEEVRIGQGDAVILPGGMPGTLHLQNSNAVKEAVLRCHALGGLTAAICAAPSVLGELGLLKGKKATCFPGFEHSLKGAVLSPADVVRDGNIITACGAGAALAFGFAVLAALTDQATADELMNKMLYKRG